MINSQSQSKIIRISLLTPKLGELVNGILFDAKAALGPKVRFENAVKEAAEEFVTWVNINDAFVFDKVGIAYALGMTLEEAAEAYGG